MGLFSRDYDYDHGYRGSNRGSFWSRSGSSIRPDYDRDYGNMNRETSWRSGRTTRPEGAWLGSGYGGDYRSRGYDRPYKSDWQTDYGDPFGDREQGTPMRVIRGDSRRDRGGFFSRDRDYDNNFRYDSNYQGGHRSYSDRPGNDAGYNRRTFRTYGNRYDSGWF